MARTLGVLGPLAETKKDDHIDNLPAETEGDLETLLTALAEAIDRADPEAIRRNAAEVGRQLSSRKIVDSSVLRTLEVQISRYDYDQALTTIQQIRESVEGHS